MSVEVAEGLERAAQYIRDRGWTRYQHAHPRGRICLVRALELAAGVAGNWYLEEWAQLRPGYLALYHAVGDAVGTAHLTGWNDEVASSRAEVLRVLRAAAWRARQEED